jgi:hypothetical protein
VLFASCMDRVSVNSGRRTADSVNQTISHGVITQ